MTIDIAELREWASNRLAKFKLPTGMKIVEALPRNATGKVKKGSLRELFSLSHVQGAPTKASDKELT